MTVDAVAAHERRLATLDPLLPGTHPLPEVRPDDVRLAVNGAVGIARLDRPDPTSIEATWGAAEQHRLLARVGGPDPVAAMSELLTRWRALVPAQPGAAGPDTEALLSWPSRDVAMTSLFLAHGLTPQTVVAVRPAGRSRPAVGGGATVRPIAPPDLDATTALWLELIRWDAQFGTGCVERPATAGALRDALGRPDLWTWVAEVDGRVDGLLMIDPPERAGWVAPMTAAAPAGYLGCLVVTGRRRGHGAGAALVHAGHRALDAAGAGVTLLHYAGLNPLSAPFWHRCGYRPLWTTWRVSPAARLRSATL